MRYVPIAAALAALALAPSPSTAASLQVAPVSIEVPAPGAAATIKLRNEGTTVLNAQIRVFRWSQTNGEEKLEPTDDVVASPPLAALAPQTEYTVRVVRVTKRPVAGGETYRLLVDELPDPKLQRNRMVTLVLRYSIPVFFYSREAAAAKLAWAIERRDGRVYVTATNSGDRHVRISALKIKDASGATISFGDGLTGYVLGRSSMRWVAPGQAHRLGAGSSVVISAQSDYGPISATSPVQAAR
jgi:fimbrial chaperone protein